MGIPRELAWKYEVLKGKGVESGGIFFYRYNDGVYV